MPPIIQILNKQMEKEFVAKTNKQKKKKKEMKILIVNKGLGLASKFPSKFRLVNQYYCTVCTSNSNSIFTFLSLLGRE